MRTPKSTLDPAGPSFTEDAPSKAAAAGVLEVRTGGEPGLNVAPAGGLSPSAMASAVQHVEAVKSRALAVLVAVGTHDEHVHALLELRAAVAGMQDLGGAGRLLPTGVSAPTRKHLAVTDDQSLLAAAAAALAHMEDA